MQVLGGLFGLFCGGVLAYAFVYQKVTNDLAISETWSVANFPFPIGWILLLGCIGGLLLAFGFNDD
jgi:hypothetical protein